MHEFQDGAKLVLFRIWVSMVSPHQVAQMMGDTFKND